jgi:hypothetical protein
MFAALGFFSEKYSNVKKLSSTKKPFAFQSRCSLLLVGFEDSGVGIPWCANVGFTKQKRKFATIQEGVLREY